MPQWFAQKRFFRKGNIISRLEFFFRALIINLSKNQHLNFWKEKNNPVFRKIAALIFKFPFN
jgi:hypothetical protein